MIGLLLSEIRSVTPLALQVPSGKGVDAYEYIPDFNPVIFGR